MTASCVIRLLSTRLPNGLALVRPNHESPRPLCLDQCVARCVQTGYCGRGQAKKEQLTAMKLSLKSAYFVFLVLIALFVSSCYPAHTGSGGSLSGGGGSGSGSGSSGSGSGSGTVTIGGSVIGLLGTGLVLQNNGGDDLPITANGVFTFKTAISGAYAVTVKTQPTGPAQTCGISNGTGTATSKVNNVLINCGTTGLTIGGSVSGLIGDGLVLQNNGGNNFGVSGQGNVPFTFTTPVTGGTTYAVTILTQPSNPAQVCSVVNGSGTANSNINNVEVICTQPGFKISGSVVGLVEGPGDTLELQNNAGDDLFVTGDTTFTFPTQVTNGGIYNVNVFLPPNSQPQPCNIFFYTGIAITNVSNVLVDCEHNDWDWISWYVSLRRIGPTTTLRSQRPFFLLTRFSRRTSVLPAAGTSPRPGPTNRAEIGSSVDSAFRFPHRLATKLRVILTIFGFSTNQSEVGSPPISQFIRTLRASPSFRCVPTHSNSRMFPRVALQARGGVARVGPTILPATFSCLVVRGSTVRGLSGCSMTYGNALPVLRLMVPARAPAPARGAW